MSAAFELAPLVGIVVACTALAVSRATFYRRFLSPHTCAPPRPPPARALTPGERQAILDVANSDRFIDAAPAEIVATLLDEGTYLCSTRSMYRVLESAGEVRERRNQRQHPEYRKPELMAVRPNEVWSWDITKLLQVEKWKYFYLYVVLDIYSRYVVGWLLAEHENATLAKHLLRETHVKEGIEEGQLTIHGDRGAPMTSKTLAQLMSDLTITKSHSRPHVSDDNPFSESHFKTLKYQPEFPNRFTDAAQARSFLRDFFTWYNNEHRHSGIAMMTPADVHFGRAPAVLAQRQLALDAAYAAHPERFVGGPPRAKPVPAAVYINPPPEAPATNATSLAPVLTADPDAIQLAFVESSPAGVAAPVALDMQASLHVSEPVIATSSAQADLQSKGHGERAHYLEGGLNALLVGIAEVQ